MDTKGRARLAIDQSQILEKLRRYEPAVVSTIFADLDIPGSDIDIVCNAPSLQQFVRDFESAFTGAEGLEVSLCADHALGRFRAAGFLLEVFAAPIPVERQAAYRHYGVMQRLVAAGGEAFSTAVRNLKLSGLKTEPAIARLLELPGDPYAAVLTLEQQSDRDLAKRITAAMPQ